MPVFGLFRRKEKPAAIVEAQPVEAQPVEEASRSTSKVTEWDASIAQITSDFETKLIEAIRQCEPLIASTQSDLSPIDECWGAVDLELERAKKALNRAWSSPNTILSRDPVVSESQHTFQETKLYEGECELELAYQAAYRQVRARAAQAMMQYALDRDACSRYCIGCNQALATVLVGQAQNIQCPHCFVAQTVEPGQAFRVFALAAARWVGEWDAFPHYQTMQRAKQRIERFRNSQKVPMELLHEFHDAAQSYWQTALGVEAHLVPQKTNHLESAIDANMKGARRLLRHHWQWRSFEAE